MRPPSRRAFWADDAGFTLMETLLATLLMMVILAALTTVTGQWLPNWSRGMARVQRAERLATGMERMLRDLSVAEAITTNSDTKIPYFDGSETSVTFVRTAIGPNAKPGFEVVRMAEKPDDQGLAMVREHAPFVPMPPGAGVRLADPVVLVRSPFRVTFNYAGPDQVWQSSWREQKLLPTSVRISVHDAASGRLLTASSAALLHINISAECARAKSPLDCLAGQDDAPAGQKPPGNPT